jgi:hypothetical protein
MRTLPASSEPLSAPDDSKVASLYGDVVQRLSRCNGKVVLGAALSGAEPPLRDANRDAGGTLDSVCPTRSVILRHHDPGQVAHRISLIISDRRRE